MKNFTMQGKWGGFCLIMLFYAVTALIAVPAQASSTRVNPQNGYAAHDYNLEDENGETESWSNGKNYSGGLDIYYTPEGNNDWDTRWILKVEDGDFDDDGTYDDIRVARFDYTGKFAEVIGQVNVGDWSWSQTIKLDPAKEKIWFSYTTNGGGGKFYSVNVDGTGITDEMLMPSNWEVEWSTDTTTTGQGGVAFFCGLNSTDWRDPHSIFIRNAGQWQRVVEIGGYSCGFAFDNNGNLWSGAYVIGGEGNYIYKWSAAAVDNAVDTNTPLTPANASAKFPIPVVTNPGTGATYTAGPNDVECDPDGNIYFTANGGFDEDENTECGYVIMIHDLSDTPTVDDSWVEGSSSTSGAHWNYISKSTHNVVWDWQKALAYDGESNIDAGGHTDPTQNQPTGNRLYLDVDLNQSQGPDTIVGLTKDGDADTDGVPDSLDNAYLTPNSGQTDADYDMYGNICDGDFNNTQTVNYDDFLILNDNWLTSDPVTNMNSEGIVDYDDFLLFKGQWFSNAPWY